MTKLKTLNEMTQLKESGFGQPCPRHGLQLLYWFATECVSFNKNNEMLSQCYPEDGEFGFHYFENRYDAAGVRLLPDVDFPYYVVGNLHSRGAEDLPDYVSDENTGEQDGSNIDRIIVSLDDESFDRVYITSHMDESDYDINSTYRISKNLLKIIARWCLKGFLNEMGYWRNPEDRFWPPVNYNSQSVNKTTHTGKKQEHRIEIGDSARRGGFWDSFCTIL